MMARQATEWLIEIIHGEPSAEAVGPVALELVVRESTAAG
jgi:DNA-binding LacI/PurR family transcriptional regulator